MNSCCPKKKIPAAHFRCQKSNLAAQKNKNVAAQKSNFAAQSNKFAAHFTNSLKLCDLQIELSDRKRGPSSIKSPIRSNFLLS